MEQYTADKLKAAGVEDWRIQDRNLAGLNLSDRDLSGIDLRGFTLTKTNLESADLFGTDLRGIRFAGANCVSARFTGADLRGAILSFGYFNNANFNGADLRGARVVDSLCSDSNFVGADLRGAVLGTEHYNSDFRGADLRGAEMPADSSFEKLNCDTRGALMVTEGPVDRGEARRLARARVVPGIKVFDRRTSKEVGELIDITPEGMRLRCTSAEAMGSVVFYQVAIPEGFPHGPALHVDARCVWSRTEEGTGNYLAGFSIDKVAEGRHTIEELIRECEGRAGEAPAVPPPPAPPPSSASAPAAPKKTREPASSAIPSPQFAIKPPPKISSGNRKP